MSRNDEQVTAKGLIIRRTDNAILFEQEHQDHWIPRSLISYMQTDPHGSTIKLPEWKADELGLRSE